MAKYRRKPVEFEAFCFDGDFKKSNGEYYAPDWVVDALHDGVLCFKGQGELYAETLEGSMRVDVGDYIIQGINGEIYPCKPYIFEQIYEEVIS